MATNQTSRAGNARKAASAALSPDTILDLVQRLGVVDIAVDKVRSRIEDIDFDELLDDAGRYVRRNPEVVVIGLGVLTIAAAAVVYLDHRLDDDRRWGSAVDLDDDDDEDDDAPAIRAVTPPVVKRPTAAPRATSSARRNTTR